jgi:hypothetical protein
VLAWNHSSFVAAALSHFQRRRRNSLFAVTETIGGRSGSVISPSSPTVIQPV